jgi:hypothetical protein
VPAALNRETSMCSPLLMLTLLTASEALGELTGECALAQ